MPWRALPGLILPNWTVAVARISPTNRCTHGALELAGGFVPLVGLIGGAGRGRLEGGGAGVAVGPGPARRRCCCCACCPARGYSDGAFVGCRFFTSCWRLTGERGRCKCSKCRRREGGRRRREAKKGGEERRRRRDTGDGTTRCWLAFRMGGERRDMGDRERSCVDVGSDARCFANGGPRSPLTVGMAPWGCSAVAVAWVMLGGAAGAAELAGVGSGVGRAGGDIRGERTGTPGQTAGLPDLPGAANPRAEVAPLSPERLVPESFTASRTAITKTGTGAAGIWRRWCGWAAWGCTPGCG